MQQTIDVHEEKPSGFVPEVEVGAFYIACGDEILLMQLAHRKKEAGFWGVPAGKIQEGEGPCAGAVRELFEETGIMVDPLSNARSIGALYMCNRGFSYVYHLFEAAFDSKPAVTLSDEHQAYRWVRFSELHDLPLMTGAWPALRYYSIRRSPASLMRACREVL